jgi:hypothetical protein
MRHYAAGTVAFAPGFGVPAELVAVERIQLRLLLFRRQLAARFALDRRAYRAPGGSSLLAVPSGPQVNPTKCYCRGCGKETNVVASQCYPLWHPSHIALPQARDVMH